MESEEELAALEPREVLARQRRDGGGWRISSSFGLGGAFAVGTPHVAVKDEDGKTVVLS